MYKALYRTWRPMSFDDVISQPHITATFKIKCVPERRHTLICLRVLVGRGKPLVPAFWRKL